MGPRLTPDQLETAETAALASTLAGWEVTQFSLEQLEAGTEDIIDPNLLASMTPEQLQQMVTIAYRFETMYASDIAIDGYKKEHMKEDLLFLSQFFKPTYRAKAIVNANSISQEQVDSFQVIMKSAAEVRRKREAERDLESELSGLGRKRMDMLAHPDLDIGPLMHSLKAEVGDQPNSVQMAAFRSRLLPEIVERLDDWAAANEEFFARAEKIVDTPGWEDEYWAEDENGGITSFSQSGLGIATGGVLGVGGNLFSDMIANRGRTRLKDDPVLSVLFSDKQFGKPIMDAAKTGNFDASTHRDVIMASLQAAFPDTLSFAKIQEQFGDLYGLEIEEMTPEQLKALDKKMSTVPKYFVGSEKEDEYFRYVTETVAGKGAEDFDKWLLANTEGIMYLWYSIVLMIPSEWQGFLPGSSGGGADDTEEQQIGEYRFRIKERLASGALPPEAVDPNAPIDEQLEAAYGEPYKKLQQIYRDSISDQTATMSLQVGGFPLTPESLLSQEHFSSIVSLVREENKAVQLLGMNLNVEDLDDLATYYGDSGRPDSINVRFKDDGIFITRDTALGFNARWDRTWLSYEDLAKPEGAGILSAAIREIKGDVDIETEKVESVEDLRPYLPNLDAHKDKFAPGANPAAFVVDGELSPALRSIIELGDDFWEPNGTLYQMTQEDLNALEGELDSNFWFFWKGGAVNDTEDAVTDDGKIRGSSLALGFWKSKKGKTAEEFFDWLK